MKTGDENKEKCKQGNIVWFKTKSQNWQYKEFMVDSKENYCWDRQSEMVNQHWPLWTF